MIRCLPQRWVWAFALGFMTLCAPALAGWFSSRYSPRDAERPRRSRTDYIVLHTTEGAVLGAFRKLFQNGEAHFLVDRSGRVYMIIRQDKVAYHAGRSMWHGRENIDNCSIGIEVVGNYNGSVTDAQCAAIRQLLDNLKRSYRVSDDRVLTHSMVAYGGANRWFSTPHRGRKRCGMLFANPSLRLRLGLHSQPLYDPDVAAGRLTAADAYLARMLYGAPLPTGTTASTSAGAVPAPRSRVR